MTDVLSDAEWEALQERDPALAEEIVRALELHALTTVESLIEGEHGFGIGPSSGKTLHPAQRAVCRMLDGVSLGELASHPDVIELVGGADAVAALPCERGERPDQLALLSAIRSLKTILALASAVNMALRVDLSRLTPDEIPLVPIVSLKKELAASSFGLLRRTIQRSPVLSRLLVGKPKADSLLLRHPSGRVVEIAVVAGAKAGAGLISRWLAGVVFDEAPRMAGQSDGVVNLDDARSAIMGRLPPGAMVLYIGSPWAPLGPVYTMHKEHFSRPSQDLVVLHGPGWILNPTEWTPEKLETLKRKDPTAYLTDACAMFLDRETQLFHDHVLRARMRAEPDALPPAVDYEGKLTQSYAAATDPAMRGNRWTLVVVTRDGTTERGAPHHAVALTHSYQPGADGTPLDPDEIFKDIAKRLHPYGVKAVRTDQYAFDALAPSARRAGLSLVGLPLTATEQVGAYNRMRVELENGELELGPDDQVREDLVRIRQVATRPGLAIELPQTSDGGHCDYAPALLRARLYALPPPRQAAPRPGTPEAAKAKDDVDRRTVFRKVRERKKEDLRRGTFGGSNRVTKQDVLGFVLQRKGKA